MGVEDRRADARREMQKAKALLDDGGVMSAATYLEYAIACIDLAGEIGSARDDAPPIIAPCDPVLVRAIGEVMAIIGTILARGDLVSLDELGRLFTVLATVSVDDDPAKGAIMAAWGRMLLDVAPNNGSANVG